MLDFLTRLLDPSGFPPRRLCGTGWSEGLIWLHQASDLFIWLAYVSIPLMLLYLTHRRDLPYPRIFLLFSLFILSCGTTHLIDAFMFDYPIYRLAGLVKLITAVASWTTVLALVPIVPRVMYVVGEAQRAGVDLALSPLPPAAGGAGRASDYAAAVVGALVGLLARSAIDPFVNDFFFIVALLPVVYISWRHGFGPGMVCLAVGMMGYSYLFIEPRRSLLVSGLDNQLAVSLFFFGGAACAALGESQREAQRRARMALEAAVARREELETEVERRRRVESALREQEQDLLAAERETAVALARLNAFLDNAPLGIAFLSADLRYIRVNPSLAAAHGIPIGDHIGRTPAEVDPGVSGELLEVYRHAAAGSGAAVAREVRRPDARLPGVDRIWRELAFPIRDPDGEGLGAGIVAEDITQHREALEELQRSERKFRTLAEALPSIVWVARPDGSCEYFNQLWYTTTGLDESESLGPGWLAAVHPEDRGRTEARWLRSTTTGEDYEIEYRFRVADGSYRWFLGRGLPERDASGQVVRWIGTCTDIDDQRSAADAVRASEAFRRSIFENSPDCLKILDLDGRLVEMNAGGCRLMEVDDFATLRGHEWSALWPPEGRFAVMEALRAAAAGEIGRFQADCPTAKGHPKSWDVLVAPIPDADGRPHRLLVVSRDVSEQRRAEERLRESEEMFRQLAESIPQLAWMTDPDGYIFWYNERWYEYTGTTPEEMMGWGWRAVHDPRELPRVEAKFRAHLASGEPWEDTFPLRGRDGKFRWHLSRARPLKDADGKVVRWFGTNTDITAQREMEESLRASELRFRTLTGAIPQIVWTADASGTGLAFVNRRLEDYLRDDAAGVPEAGRSWSHLLIHPDDAVRLDRRWREAQGARSERFNEEFRIRRSADESYRWMIAVGVPLGDPAGGADTWVGSLTDIDDQKRQAEILELMVRSRTAELVAEVEERKRVEAEVRKQQEFLDVILSNVTDGIVACDDRGRLTLFNRAAREFHGLSAEPLPPERWADRYDLYRADGVTPLPMEEIPLLRALRGEQVRDAEMVVAPRGTAPRFLLASGRRLSDHEGKNLGAVVSMRDVTEQREADRQIREASAELRRANFELKRSNGELEKFAYVASHDLQEPLRKIQAFGDRLRERCRDQMNEQAQEYVDRMLSAAGRMRRLIDDLLTFSRVTTQHRPFERVDLTKVARDVVSDLDHRIAQVGGEVIIGALPTIDANPTQMRQLLQNLIANGLKFHKPGRSPRVEVEGEITLGSPNAPIAAESQPICRLIVRDDGIGFDEKYKDRIFEVFQRLHGREDYEGTGVGLAICRKIVERHGGSINARSRQGEGAVFEVTLPARHSNLREGVDDDA